MSELLAELNSLLFGDGMDVEEIEKFEPDSSDLSTWRQGKYKLSPKQRSAQSYKNFGGKKKNDTRQRAVTAGLSSVGAGAGAYGLGVAASEIRRNTKKAKKLSPKLKGAKALRAGLKATPRPVKGLIPLELAGLGGEVMATKILHDDVKEKKLVKRWGAYEAMNLGIGTASAAAGLAALAQNKRQNKQIKTVQRGARKTRLIAEETGKAVLLTPPTQPHKIKVNAVKGAIKGVRTPVDKADVTFSGELSKLDADKRQVFGWASVTKVNGEDVLDRQGDYIALEEVEKSAYHYVHHSRKGGDMHERDGEHPLQKSDMIESFVVTPEKLEKMGLETDALPHGWWVGYSVTDEDLWQKVKEGKRVGFSIHGKGVRTPMEV